MVGFERLFGVFSLGCAVRMNSRTWALASSPESKQITPSESVIMTAGFDNTSYRVSFQLARECQLLHDSLDELDLHGPGDDDDSLEVNIPNGTGAALAHALKFFEYSLVKTPSIIGRPLRAPLDQVVQGWEWDYLMAMLEGGVPSQNRLLFEVISVADFLVCEALRDLCCAFLAHLVINCRSESEILQLLGRDEPLGEEELQELYAEYPFLEAGEGAASPRAS